MAIKLTFNSFKILASIKMARKFEIIIAVDVFQSAEELSAPERNLLTATQKAT